MLPLYSQNTEALQFLKGTAAADSGKRLYFIHVAYAGMACMYLCVSMFVISSRPNG